MRERGESIRQAVDEARNFTAGFPYILAEGLDIISKERVTPTQAVIWANILGGFSVAYAANACLIHFSPEAQNFYTQYASVAGLPSIQAHKILLPMASSTFSVSALSYAPGIKANRDVPVSTFVLPQAARALRAVGNFVSTE